MTNETENNDADNSVPHDQKTSSQSAPWTKAHQGLPAGTKSLGTKFFLLGVLAVLLCIPLFMVWGLVKEREHNYRQATAEIGRQWGADQTIGGPLLAVPAVMETTQNKDGKNVVRRFTRDIFVVPDTLEIKGDVETTRRVRGIHEAIVYQSGVDMVATFTKPDLRSFSDNFVSVDWSRARLVVSVSDLKGVVDVKIMRAGKSVGDVEPGLGITSKVSNQINNSGLHVGLDMSKAYGNAGIISASEKPITFDLALVFKGSQTLSFIPVGESTKVSMRSAWPHPSFSGNFLPTKREVGEKGFDAEWMVSKLARSIPHISYLDGNTFHALKQSAFGVRFYQPVDFYRLVDRAVKYGVLFIGMAFLIIFAVEILSKGRMHAVHYTMSGMMVIMFYVLLLALAEMIGFSLAYGVAAGATGAVLAGFVSTFFKGKQASIIAVGGFGILYGLLYLVLRLEDAALLAGSITGFAILTAMMFATRNIDWSGRGDNSVS